MPLGSTAKDARSTEGGQPAGDAEAHEGVLQGVVIRYPPIAFTCFGFFLDLRGTQRQPVLRHPNSVYDSARLHDLFLCAAVDGGAPDCVPSHRR